MMYFKSVFTGQVYKLDFVPSFGGYVPATEQEYLDWCRANGIPA